MSRQAALSTILELVKSHSMSRSMPQKIMGTLLGGLLPRCADRSLAVQQTALDTIYRLLTIQLSDQGLSLEQQEEAIGVLKTRHHETLNSDSQCLQVAGVVSKSVPHDQLDTLLLMAFDNLADQHQSCANMAAQVVETILTNHHQELQDKVSEMIDVLGVHFLFIPYQEVKRRVLRIITILTSHSSTAAVSHQLTCHIPGEEFKDVRRAACEDTDCAVSTLKHLVNSLQRKSCPISGNMYSTITSLVAIVGVYDIITQPEMEVVSTLFPLIFKGLLISLTSYVNFSLDPSEERFHS
ncbi:maestro heat-like repeat-containing protein family member 1 [Scyliorhinus canicula]|uniref:maestro heat-like repeat-containing protein family member 1 n=1 Tax=Scyliorhinus canicula TaxID=7830 RepID=UPI0018F3F43E|nr:maestro heat-like repeat-containing protein family member 1 [Scyliorhinus canicula]